MTDARKCPRCGGPLPRGQRKCDACLLAHSSYQRNRRQELKAAGKCPTCTGNPETCGCREYHRDRMRARRALASGVADPKRAAAEAKRRATIGALYDAVFSPAEALARALDRCNGVAP